jgi:hypothetical protein
MNPDRIRSTTAAKAAMVRMGLMIQISFDECQASLLCGTQGRAALSKSKEKEDVNRLSRA